MAVGFGEGAAEDAGAGQNDLSYYAVGLEGEDGLVRAISWGHLFQAAGAEVMRKDDAPPAGRGGEGGQAGLHVL